MTVQDAGANDIAIEFRNVSLSFDDDTALVDVSFRLEQGEMILLTGNSGAGKSVLLRLAIGLLIPDVGQIFINGREIEKLDESVLLAVRGGLLGMVFQEDTLFSGLTVYENVAYRLEEHGWEEEKIEAAVREVLEFVGLADEEEKLPEELSGGMKRRVEIARAMIGWPPIMLFDEATLSLDPIVAGQILGLIIRARDLNKISSIYVTKRLHEIPYLGKYRALEGPEGIKIVKAAPAQRPQTRVIVLDRGRIGFSGSVEEFESSNAPAVRSIKIQDSQYTAPRVFLPDPWDRRRRPREESH